MLDLHIKNIIRILRKNIKDWGLVEFPPFLLKNTRHHLTRHKNEKRIKRQVCLFA